MSIPQLAQKYSLCVTGESLNTASYAATTTTESGTSSESELWDYLILSIFARMSPDDKESLETFETTGETHVHVCGDGANDVGALKQAHVGVALLSGFGSANTKKLKQEGGDESKGEEEGDGEKGKKLAKAETFQERCKSERASGKVKKAKMEEKIAQQKDTKEQALQKVWFEEEFKERMAAAKVGAVYRHENSTQLMIRESKRRAMERAKARQSDKAVKRRA